MGFFEIILIGVSLSMDAFAVAICSGLKMTKIDYKKAALIALFFGGFQAIMPALGWLLGQLFASYVDKYDHYIAFALLAFLGAKMIFDVLKGGDDEDEGLGDRVDMKTLFIMAVATSIDALAVGVTFGMEPDVQIVPSALLIGATTFVISFSGVISARFPSASSAQRIMPSERIPASFAGFKLVTTMTFLPTISSGEYADLMPDTIWRTWLPIFT